MPSSEPTRTAIRGPRSPSQVRAAPVTTTIAVYGCDPEEAARFRALAPRFGVTADLIGEPLSAATVELARGRRCVSVGHKTPVTRSTLAALGRLGVEYISTRSIGTNHIDADFARSAGITVGAVTYSPDSVADYTVLLILMAVRHIRPMIKRVDDHDYRLVGPPGSDLRDLTIGVIGTGRIGTAVIDRLRAFGSHILSYDIRPTPRASSGDHDQVGLQELLRRSNILTLHIPLTAGSHHFLGREQIDHLRRGAYIVNTGRGALIDTDALLDALHSGRLAGAALDVVEGEEGIFYTDCRDQPLANSSLARLQQLPNVVISPHTAFYTDHALDDIVRETIVNCLNFENGNHHG